MALGFYGIVPITHDVLSLGVGFYVSQGFGQGESPAFRQGFAAAASIVLFFLVLIIGFLANRYVSWREERYMA